MELVNGWQHPTTTRLGLPVENTRLPKSVHLVGLGPTMNDFIRLHINPETPEVIHQRDEIWIINRGAMILQHDLAFVLDHITNEGENFPIYGRRLWKQTQPIITSDNLAGWPPHVHAYPHKQIMQFMRENFKHPPRTEWAVNSVPLIFQYAIFIGIKEMFCWGLDYHNHKSGVVEDGHPNAAYWLRVMEEAGIKVTVPMTSTFIDSNKRHFYYGYQTDPRPQAEERRQIFRMITGQNLPPEAQPQQPLEGI